MYIATVLNSPLESGIVTFIRDSNNDASLSQLLFLDDALARLTAAPDQTYTLIIRGV